MNEPAPRFRLQTLGTLRLIDTEGSVNLGDHGHHRRRLALLAVLAASGDLGRSRDFLLGLFWPESTQARARHSLEQLLYALRTSLDAQAFSGVNPLLLNSGVISSDVAGFYAALNRGELEAAVALYTGLFLDGFYLDDSPEFGQWVDSERMRAEAAYTGALESLATRAESNGDIAATVRWRQQLAQTDPLSSRHALALMQSLAQAGDHASALKHAERYESAMKSQLGAGASKEITAYAREIRDAMQSDGGSSEGAQRLPDVPVATAKQEAVAVRESEKPAVRRPAGRLRYYAALAGLLVLTAVSVTLWRSKAGTHASSSTAQPSLAVLPLSNLSGDARDAALTDGITEELIGALSRIDGLRVIARTSAFAFRGSQLGAKAIADSLRVANLLEGGVQRHDERLRVQVRLIDGSDGSTLWSESYDRDMKDLFTVQSDIAATVAQRLHIRLTPEKRSAALKVPTANLAAYELFRRGNDPALLRSDSSAAAALEYFRQAVALDTNYAAPYAGIARMYLRLRGSARLEGSSLEKYTRAKEAAMKGVALDPSLPDAQATLGLVRMIGGDFEAARESLERAVSLDPFNSRIREWMSFYYLVSDRPREGLAETLKAVDNEPLSPSAHAEAGRALCLNGRVPEGLVRLRVVDGLRPPLARARGYMAMCHGIAGDWDAAASVLPRGEERLGAAILAHTFGRVGKTDSAKAVLSNLMAHWNRSNDGAFLVAIVHAGLGDKDATFEWLNRSIDEAAFIPQMTDPFFNDLKADSRYAEFQRRLGTQKR